MPNSFARIRGPRPLPRPLFVTIPRWAFTYLLYFRYEILGKAGDGSFGCVFRARHRESGDLVAVKQMKGRFNDWAACLELREVASLRAIHHPAIIRLREVVRMRGSQELFLIFDHMVSESNRACNTQQE